MATSDETVMGEAIVVEPSEEHGNFPPFDASTFASQLLWFAITFALLYYLMARVALPRIGGILENRRDRIAADLDQAERLKGESEDAAAAYDKALSEARSRASGIADGAREAAKSKADAQRAEVEEDLGRKLADAEARIADIKSRALAEVGTIASDAAEAVVTTLVETKVTAGEVKDAVTEALAARSLNA